MAYTAAKLQPNRKQGHGQTAALPGLSGAGNYDQLHLQAHAGAREQPALYNILLPAAAKLSFQT